MKGKLKERSIKRNLSGALSAAIIVSQLMGNGLSAFAYNATTFGLVLHGNAVGAEPNVTAGDGVTINDEADNDKTITLKGDTTEGGSTDVSIPDSAFLRSGYTLLGYADAGEEETAYVAGFTVDTADLESDKQIYAKWQENSYTINYDANSGSGGAMASTTGSYTELDGDITANTYEKTGYGFDGWSLSKSSAASIRDGAAATDVIAAAEEAGTVKDGANNYSKVIDLYARWTPNIYQIAYEAGVGAAGATVGVRTNATAAIVDATDKTLGAQDALDYVKYSRRFALPEATKAGYTFKGWGTSPETTTVKYAAGAEVSNLTSENGGVVTLYAIFTQDEYTVKFNTNGGGSIANVTLKSGEISNAIADSTISKAGYELKATGTWTLKDSEIGTAINKGGSVNIDAWVEAINNAYATAGEDASEELQAVYDELVNNKTITFYAQWDPMDVSVTYNSNDGTYDTVNKSIKYDAISSAALIKNPFAYDGHNFIGWALEENATSEDVLDAAGFRTALLATSESGYILSVYAVWGGNYTVTYDGSSADNWITVAALDRTASVDEGEEYTLEDFGLTKANYEFAGWEDKDGTIYEAGETVTITESTTFKAKFVAHDYTLAIVDPVNEINLYSVGFTADDTEVTIPDYATFTRAKAHTALKDYYKTYTEGQDPFSDKITLNGKKIDADSTGYTIATLIAAGEVAEDGTVTIYADVETADVEVTVSPNASDAILNGEEVEGDITSYVTSGTTVDLSNYAFGRAGYKLSGFNTKADGTGANKAVNATFTVTESTTLYAQWEAVEYTIELYKNGTTKESETTVGLADDFKATIPAIPSSFTVKGYTDDEANYPVNTKGEVFLGWTTTQAESSFGTYTYNGYSLSAATYELTDDADLRYTGEDISLEFAGVDGDQTITLYPVLADYVEVTYMDTDADDQGNVTATLLGEKVYVRKADNATFTLGYKVPSSTAKSFTGWNPVKQPADQTNTKANGTVFTAENTASAFTFYAQYSSDAGAVIIDRETTATEAAVVAAAAETVATQAATDAVADTKSADAEKELAKAQKAVEDIQAAIATIETAEEEAVALQTEIKKSGDSAAIETAKGVVNSIAASKEAAQGSLEVAQAAVQDAQDAVDNLKAAEAAAEAAAAATDAADDAKDLADDAVQAASDAKATPTTENVEKANKAIAEAAEAMAAAEELLEAAKEAAKKTEDADAKTAVTNATTYVEGIADDVDDALEAAGKDVAAAQKVLDDTKATSDAKDAAKAAEKAAEKAEAAAKAAETNPTADTVKAAQEAAKEATAAAEAAEKAAAATGDEAAKKAATEAATTAKKAATTATEAATAAQGKIDEAAKKAEDETKKAEEAKKDGSAEGTPAPEGRMLKDSTGKETGFKVTDATPGAAKATYVGKAEDKNKKSFTVPASTTDQSGNKYEVTAIDEKAFDGSKVETLTVPNTVKVFKKNALKGSKVKKVVIKVKKGAKVKDYKFYKNCFNNGKKMTIVVKCTDKKLKNKIVKKINNKKFINKKKTTVK